MVSFLRVICLKDLFSQVFGEVTGTGLGSSVQGIATDSREYKADDLYIALKGKRTDGHTVLKALEIDGCAAALVSEENNELTSLKQIIVEDPLTTIGTIANKWRKQFQVPTLGITGTNGKTSTKDLLHHVFQPTQTVHATEKNFNTIYRSSSKNCKIYLYCSFFERYKCSIIEQYE